MFKKLTGLTVGVAAVVAGFVLFGGAALADGLGPFGDGTCDGCERMGPAYGRMAAGQMGPVAGPAIVNGRDIAVEAAAKLTGLTPEQIAAELAGGKTIPVLLQEKGVDLEAFETAVQEAHLAAIDRAVAEGRLTREAGDQLRERIASEDCEPVGGQYGRQWMAR